MTVPETKRQLRRTLFDARRAQPPARRAHENAALIDTVTAFLVDRDAQLVAAYMPVESEPGGTDFVAQLRSRGYRVVVPISHEDRSMSWLEITDETEFAAGPFGISEPVGSPLPAEFLNDVDVVLAPALAADRRGYRLGKGGGYYDRALVALTTPTVAALVFSTELLDEVPHEPHDTGVDFVVTPGEIFAVNATF